MKEELYKTQEELMEKLNQSPAFRKAGRALKPYYDLVFQIINRRTELGMTQKDLAEKANTFQSRVSKIESGEHDIRLSTLIQIAEALDTEVKIVLEPIQEDEFIPGNEKGYMNLFRLVPGVRSFSDYTESRTGSSLVHSPVYGRSE